MSSGQLIIFTHKKMSYITDQAMICSLICSFASISAGVSDSVLMDVKSADFE